MCGYALPSNPLPFEALGTLVPILQRVLSAIPTTPLTHPALTLLQLHARIDAQVLHTVGEAVATAARAGVQAIAVAVGDAPPTALPLVWSSASVLEEALRVAACYKAIVSGDVPVKEEETFG